MKKKALTIVLILLGILVLICVCFNIYKFVIHSQYNTVISFANKYYPYISDNSFLEFNIDINPLSIIDEATRISSKQNEVKEQILQQYNLLTDNISSLTAEIIQKTNQANTFSLVITDNFDFSDNTFPTTNSYDEDSLKSAKQYYDNLNNYKGYLTSLFDDYKLLKSSQGNFSNPLWGYSDTDLKNLIDSLTNEEKAGQLLFFSIDGWQLTQDQMIRYKNLNPGGIIIMGKNAGNTKQLQALTKQIQSINTKIPMFIPTDQEGGPVKRISWDTTKGQKSWSTMSDEDLCKEASDRAKLLLNLGINMNFSPVVDVAYTGNNFMNNRTISNDPQIVLSKSKTYITCSQDNGIIDTLKHFPGHGPAFLDSHFYLPTVLKNKSDWFSTDAVPFFGNLDTKQIMIGHLFYTLIDSENPASFSSVFLTDILRNEWGYKGLIITDDMNMIHTSTKISVGDALKKTFNAGADIAIYVGAPTSFEDVKNQLTFLISSGDISDELVDEKLFRILQVKRNLYY